MISTQIAQEHRTDTHGTHRFAVCINCRNFYQKLFAIPVCPTNWIQGKKKTRSGGILAMQHDALRALVHRFVHALPSPARPSPAWPGAAFPA
jgi:hypothetical protein